MSDFAKRFEASDRVNAAGYLFCDVQDMLTVCAHALLHVDKEGAQRIACACSGVLEVALAISYRAEDGHDLLAQRAGVGIWRGEEAA